MYKLNSSVHYSSETDGRDLTSQTEMFENARTYILQIFHPVLIVFGVLGNTLTLLVLLRNIRILTSTAVYLLALAISNIVVLLTGPLRAWIKVVWGLDIRYLSDAGCRVEIYLTYVSVHVSAWLLMAVVLGTVVKALAPARIRPADSPRFACGVIFGLLIVIGSVDAFVPIVTRLHGYTGNLCAPSTMTFLELRDNVFEWVDFSLAFGIPSVTFLIAIGILILRKKTFGDNKLSVDESLGIMKPFHFEGGVLLAICLCVVFMVTMTPASIFLAYYPYWERYFRRRAVNMELLEARRVAQRVLLLHDVLNLVSYLNAACSFMLYMVCSSRFRNAMTQMSPWLKCTSGVDKHGHGNIVTGQNRETDSGGNVAMNVWTVSM